MEIWFLILCMFFKKRLLPLLCWAIGNSLFPYLIASFCYFSLGDLLTGLAPAGLAMLSRMSVSACMFFIL